MLGVRTIFRLSKTSLISLFENRSRVLDSPQRLNDASYLVSAQLEWRRKHVVVRGSTNVGGLTVAFEGRQGQVFSDSFEVRMARPDKFSGVNIHLTGTKITLDFPAPGQIRKFISYLLALPSIILELAKATPDIITFLKTKDAATAARLRIAFNIESQNRNSCILPGGQFFREKNLPSKLDDITIIVPVYNALRDLCTLLQCLDGNPHEIILINDGSDDPTIAKILKKFTANNANAKIITNKVNQGFVAASNLGIQHATGNVILLNSDAIPPSGDWASRLVFPIIDDDNIASVTPFSNNAEILSIPSPNNRYDIYRSAVDKIDEFASKFQGQTSVIDLPTGIGFCMAMNKDFISQIGGFDTTFGHGYGEEVDWCQKALRAGGRNVGLASLFVGHKGGSSFGNQKIDRIRAATKIIDARYPDYEKRVQEWVQEAPAQPQSLALSISWLSAMEENPVPVFIGHSMGGGAEAALQKEVDECLKTNLGVLILRVGGPLLWRIELIGRDFTYVGDASSKATVLQFLKPLEKFRLVYSCGVGGRHPLDAAHLISALIDQRCTLELRVHDFFLISPSWNLMNGHGRFEGVPDLNTSDHAHRVPALDGRASVSHQSWRNTWAQVVEKAQIITVFSHASGTLISQAYPEAAGKIRVTPHQLCNAPRKMRKGGQVIGVLGSLNKAKGAEVVQRLSQHPTLSRQIVVLGEMDGAFKLLRPHVFHGRYCQDQIADLAEKYDIGLWLIPSICPETFSFSTHEALATDLPVLAFARGAQGEAVTVASNGHAMDIDPDNTNKIISSIEAAFLTSH